MLVNLQDIKDILTHSMRLHSTPMWVMINKFFEKRISKLHIEPQWTKLTSENRPDSEVLILCDSWCQYVWYIHWTNHYEVLWYDRYDLVTHFQPLPLPPNIKCGWY